VTNQVLGARLCYLHFMGQNPPGQHFLEWTRKTPSDGLLLLRSPFMTSRLLVTKPRALADLLAANAYDFVKPKPIRDFLRKVLGDGLIVIEGDAHRFQRKHTMPAFSFRHIKDLYPMMWRKAIALTEAVEEEIKRKPNDIDEKGPSGTAEINSWASKVTLDIIGLAAMGTEFNVLKNTDNQIVLNYEELLEPTKEKALFFLFSVFLGRRIVGMMPWGLNEVFERCTSSLGSICQDLVREKREVLKTKGEKKEDHFDIVSILIQSNNFSDRELAEQLLTFLAAG
jgi:cytochrome P450